MKTKFNLTLVLFLFLFTTVTYAVEPLPDNLINLASQPGLALLKDNLNENSLKLLSHFTTQKTVTYCGVASAVMVLNSANIAPPIDSQHAPYRYFNQDDFFNDQVKRIITPEEVQKNGISLMTLSKIIQTYGLKTKPYFANELNLLEFRKILTNAILNQQFIIVNFLRNKLHQQGNGHHSLIAAYNEQTDRFLILDVSRYKYPAYWTKTEDLWKAINTIDDNGAYRGFIIINP